MSALLWSLSLNEFEKPFYLLLSRIRKIWDCSGSIALIKYLKECNRIVMVWTTETIVKDSINVPVGLRNGLPSIIPGKLRYQIESGNTKVLRGVLTVLSLYRIISTLSSLKLSTITDPFKGIHATISESEIGKVGELFKQFGVIKLPKFKNYSNIVTAGCNYRVSTLSAPYDAIALKESEVFEDFKNMCDLTAPQILEDFEEEYSIIKPHQGVLTKTDFNIGKLSTKVEAAGKVRVFAITDWWTQNLLLPLHDMINRLLKAIPQDGTFDQTKPLFDLTNRIGKGYMVSYDLSAATDRLPLIFQIDVLSFFLGKSYSNSWGNLLRNRDWLLKQDHEGNKLNLKLRYSVGQPMGAYSSFAMLALSHHFIVQIAAQRANLKGWFSDYALLGDDIVIANPFVASHYLYIMRDYFGVEINLSKSLESNNGVSEFAKRLNTPNGQLTAIGPKVLLQSIRNVNYLPALFIDLMNKGCEYEIDAIRSLFSRPIPAFKRVQGHAWTKVLWCLISPFGNIKSDVLLPVLANNSDLPQKDIRSFGYELNAFLVDKYNLKLQSSQNNAYSCLENLKKLLRKDRDGLNSKVLNKLPSISWLLDLYYEKYRQARLMCHDRTFQKFCDSLLTDRTLEGYMSNLPLIISKVTPKISSEKDLTLDNLEKLAEAGKTAFDISEFISLSFAISLPKPISRKKLSNKGKVIKRLAGYKKL
jgi:hypothetical protein